MESEWTIMKIITVNNETEREMMGKERMYDNKILGSNLETFLENHTR